jgi:hypothetical protein
MMEAAGTSEMFVNVYQTTWRHNPEDSPFHMHGHRDLVTYTTPLNLNASKLI